MDMESEYIEREALTDLHASATETLKGRLGLKCIPVGSALVSIAGALPTSAIVINRALGIGLSSCETEKTVHATIRTYRESGVKRFFLQRHPASKPSGPVELFLLAGLVKTRGWQKFRRGTSPVPEINTDLEIREIGPDHSEEAGKIICDGFDLGQTAAPWLALLAGRRGWHLFMSFADDKPAGVGALFIKDGIGWTDFAATTPAFRRRGSQGALLARRIEFALDHGCQQIFTCTGEDVSGDPQHSYRNILRMGFEKDYLRENYAPK